MATFYGYHIIEFLGKGSYGTVVRARNQQTGETHAIKLVEDLMKTEHHARHLYREIKIMRKLTELNKNIFTTKIEDVLLPPKVYIPKEENDNDDTINELLKDPDYVNDLHEKIKVFSGDLFIDLD